MSIGWRSSWKLSGCLLFSSYFNHHISFHNMFEMCFFFQTGGSLLFFCKALVFCKFLADCNFLFCHEYGKSCGLSDGLSYVLFSLHLRTYAINKLGNVRHKEENARFETEQRRCNNSVKKSIRTVSILPSLLSENYILILVMEKILHQFIRRISFSSFVGFRVQQVVTLTLDFGRRQRAEDIRAKTLMNGRVTMVHGTLASWAYMVFLCLNPELDPPDLKPFGDGGYYPVTKPSKVQSIFIYCIYIYIFIL